MVPRPPTARQTAAVDGGAPEWLGDEPAPLGRDGVGAPVDRAYDVEGLVAGRDDLRPWEDAELGPVAGLDLVHLQRHIGSDTIAGLVAGPGRRPRLLGRGDHGRT